MLRRRRPLLFSAPAPPSPGSRSGRGGTERPPAAQNSGGGGGRHDRRDRAAPGGLPGPEQQLRRPRDARRPDAGRAAAAASRQVSCSFQNFSLRHLCSSSLLLRSRLRKPSALRAPPRRSQPPGRICCLQSLWVPSGKFLDQVVVPIGRRGAEERGDKEAEANQAAAAGGGARPGRDDFRGRWTGHPGSRGARAPNAGRRWRGDSGAPEPRSCRPRAALEWLDLGCDSSRLGRRRAAGSRPVPGS